MTDPPDTNVAPSPAPPPGTTAIVRLSGPEAFTAAFHFFQPKPTSPVREQSLHAGGLQLPGLHSPIPTEIYAWPEPRSYTGQDLAEIHMPSSPPLIDLVIGHLLTAGT